MNRYLSAMDYTGKRQVNDMLDEWFSGDEQNFLSMQPGAPVSGHIQDMWYVYLRAQGYAGALTDMLAAYWEAPSREILTLSGTQFGQRVEAQTLETGDEVKFEIATSSVGAASRFLSDSVGASDRQYLLHNNADKIEFSGYSAMYIDEVAATTGVTSFPSDDKTHFTRGVISGTRIFKQVGQNYSGSGQWVGQILSYQLTISGVVQPPVVFDSGSIYYQLQRGTAITDIYSNNFDNNYDGWTENFGAGDSADVSGGALTLTRGTNVQLLKRTFSTVVGEKYAITANVETGTKSPQITVTGVVAGSALPTGEAFISFTAVGTSTEVTLDVAGGLGTAIFNDFILDELPSTAVLLEEFSESDWARYTLRRNYIYDEVTYPLAWVLNTDLSVFIEVA